MPKPATDLNDFLRQLSEANARIICGLRARVAHEVNRAWCEAHGDMSQKPWDEAPQWARDSAIAGAVAHYMDPATTPERRHELWSAHKIAHGWRYGTVKDEAMKTHPCLVPYADLPPEERVKDALFTAVMRAFHDEDLAERA